MAERSNETESTENVKDFSKEYDKEPENYSKKFKLYLDEHSEYELTNPKELECKRKYEQYKLGNPSVADENLNYNESEVNWELAAEAPDALRYMASEPSEHFILPLVGVLAAPSDSQKNTINYVKSVFKENPFKAKEIILKAAEAHGYVPKGKNNEKDTSDENIKKEQEEPTEESTEESTEDKGSVEKVAIGVIDETREKEGLTEKPVIIVAEVKSDDEKTKTEPEAEEASTKLNENTELE